MDILYRNWYIVFFRYEDECGNIIFYIIEVFLWILDIGSGVVVATVIAQFLSLHAQKVQKSIVNMITFEHPDVYT